MEKKEGLPFNPVAGPEKLILAQEKRTGHFYVSTDTGKIYIDTDEKNKLPVGGQINLFYGTMELTSPPADGQVEFSFSADDIVDMAPEGLDVSRPGVDDLILNSDGCFYRVIEVYDSNDPLTFNTERLTLAGTGGSVSGGGEVVGSASFRCSDLWFDNNSNRLPLIWSEKRPICNVNFAVLSKDEDGDVEGDTVGTYNLYIDGVHKQSGDVKGATAVTDLKKELDIVKQDSKQYNTIDISKYLEYKDSSAIEVKIEVIPYNGIRSPVKTAYVTTTTFNVSWEYDQTQVLTWDNNNHSVDLDWSVSGGISYKPIIIIDDNENYAIDDIPDNATSYTLDFEKQGLTHGAHKVELKATAMVNGEPISSSVCNNLIVAKEGVTTTIISCPFFEKEIKQYNTVQIPILIYNPEDPTSSGESQVIYLENSSEVGRDIVKHLDSTLHWNYTPKESGMTVLGISCNQVLKSFIVSVIDSGVQIKEDTNYVFKFKASDMASNNDVKNWNSNGIKAIFSDSFDWKNGGIQPEVDSITKEGKQCFRVPAGSSMTIDRAIFEHDSNDNAKKGKLLKIIFKTTNCQDYDALAMQCKVDTKIIGKQPSELKYGIDNNSYAVSSGCYIDNNVIKLINETQSTYVNSNDENTKKAFDNKYVDFGDGIYYCEFKEISKEPPKTYYTQWSKMCIEDSFEGLVVNAQNASFRTPGTSLITQYCEDTYIELELEICPANKNKNYVKFWVDGIPVGYSIYDDTDSFRRDDVQRKLVIGSQDCDVDIYLIKLYNEIKIPAKETENDWHIQNFIADAPNAEEMLRRYIRNDIMSTDTRGNSYISPILLTQKNPDLLVHVYDVPRVPSTADMVYGCSYKQYKGSDKPRITAENVGLEVQGTSSLGYVLAAANLNVDFKEATSFMDNLNNNSLKESGWAMSDTAKPVDFFCTKVNVASAENANNALNQEWYNLFQPYQSLWRCKDSRNRDTMEFTNGVLFIADRNITKDDPDDNKINNVFQEIPGYMDNIGNNPSTGMLENLSAYPRFYSIGQMGNSKDNTSVFHDQDNPYECCIENRDNQTEIQRMIDYSFNGNDNFIKEDLINKGKKAFSFRYVPKDAKESMATKWQDFVKWMSLSTPQPKYEKFIINTQQDYDKLAYNQITQSNRIIYQVDNKDNPSTYKIVKTFQDNGNNEYYIETGCKYGYTNLPLDKPVAYGSYTFEGYTVPIETLPELPQDYRLKDYQKNYNPLIKGISVEKYNYSNYQDNPKIASSEGYTHDTYEYRMAKMLHECEQHLCMESLIYHYLFIERHCMVDNVAKNTFWSTEDGGQVWNIVKDYDNDTADGNDNSGKLTLRYGIEPMDKSELDLPYFNAYQSTWLHFIAGLDEACLAMYKKLDSIKKVYNNKEVSVWSDKDYLEVFSTWQSMIPERCWLEDYQRKYFRPNELYKNSLFNAMIEGGQKKHQRKQFETYQWLYMDSKYEGNKTLTNKLYFKAAAADVDENGIWLPIKVYSDCYVYSKMGSTPQKVRCKKNNTVNILCATQNASDATLDITPLQAFSEVGDSKHDLNSVLFTTLELGNGGKVSTIHFGNKEGLENPNFANDFSINMPLLEELYLCNFTSQEKKLNISDLSRLQVLKANNSTFTNITLPDNAPLKTVNLSAPTSISASNLNILETFTIDDVNNLQILKFNNIDNLKEHSKSVIDQCIEGKRTFKYNLKNIKWNLAAVEDLDLDGNTIPRLEYLLNKCFTTENSQYVQELKINSLTGTIELNHNINSDKSIEIYNKYINNNTYGKLDLIFTHENAKLPLVTILDGDGKVFWKKRIEKGEILTTAFFEDANSPFGAFDIAKLYKSNTAEHKFIFNGNWKVSGNGQENTVFNNTNLPLYEESIIDDIIIQPEFITQTQTYEVEFKSVHPISKEEIVLYPQEGQDPIVVEYGTKLSGIIDQMLEKAQIIPYVDLINYPEYKNNAQGYDFIGYGIKGSTRPIGDDEIVTGKTELYAIFEFVKDISTRIHEDWFTVFVNGPKHIILPKYQLGGKITIPSKVQQYDINVFGDFKNCKISHYYFERDNSINTIISDSIGGDDPQYQAKQYLVYFDFEKLTELKEIGSSAFKHCVNLINIDLSNCHNLTAVYDVAFNQTRISNSNAIDLYLPESITYFGNASFAPINAPGNSTIKIGSQDSPLTQIPNFSGTDVFFNHKGWSSITVYVSKELNTDDFEQSLKTHTGSASINIKPV